MRHYGSLYLFLLLLVGLSVFGCGDEETTEPKPTGTLVVSAEPDSFSVSAAPGVDSVDVTLAETGGVTIFVSGVIVRILKGDGTDIVSPLPPYENLSDSLTVEKAFPASVPVPPNGSYVLTLPVQWDTSATPPLDFTGFYIPVWVIEAAGLMQLSEFLAQSIFYGTDFYQHAVADTLNVKLKIQ